MVALVIYLAILYKNELARLASRLKLPAWREKLQLSILRKTLLSKIIRKWYFLHNYLNKAYKIEKFCSTTNLMFYFLKKIYNK